MSSQDAKALYTRFGFIAHQDIVMGFEGDALGFTLSAMVRPSAGQ